jgi:hypothetical protein
MLTSALPLIEDEEAAGAVEPSAAAGMRTTPVRGRGDSVTCLLLLTMALALAGSHLPALWQQRPFPQAAEVQPDLAGLPALHLGPSFMHERGNALAGSSMESDDHDKDTLSCQEEYDW